MAKRFETVLQEQLQDPVLRGQWERTAVARAVAISVIRYRVEHTLSQKQLAERLGWKQSQVGRLELGEHNPSIDTLVHLSRTLAVEFLVDIQPPKRRRARWITPQAEQAGVVERFAADGGRIVVAAG